jgi:hypothetical protein
VSRRIHLATVIALAALATLAACVSRVAPYDEVLASGLTGLRSNNALFFDQLHEAAGTAAAGRERYGAWYTETRIAVGALRSRAATYGNRNDATVNALELLEQSIAELEAAHTRGFSAAEVRVLRTLFDSQLHMLIELEAAKKRATAAEVSL